MDRSEAMMGSSAMGLPCHLLSVTDLEGVTKTSRTLPSVRLPCLRFVKVSSAILSTKLAGDLGTPCTHFALLASL